MPFEHGRRASPQRFMTVGLVALHEGPFTKAPNSSSMRPYRFVCDHTGEKRMTSWWSCRAGNTRRRRIGSGEWLNTSTTDGACR